MKKFKEKIKYNEEESQLVIEYSTSKSLGLPSSRMEINYVYIFLPGDTIQFLATDKQVDLIRARLSASRRINGIAECNDNLIDFTNI